MEFVTTLQSTFDDRKPSLFELLSEAQLASLLPPSIRYLLAIATQRNPRYLLRVLNSFDELYAVLQLAVEHHYLTKYGGSFTENFYGLKRERSLAVGEVPRTTIAAPGHVREALTLKNVDIWKNIAVMAGVPYIKRKLDEGHEIHAPRTLLGANYTRMPTNPTLKQRFLHYYRWFLNHIYPSVNAAYQFSILAFNIAYLFDNSKYHSPLMWLVSTRMRRLGQEDYQAITERESSGSARANLGITSLFAPRLIVDQLSNSLKFLLPTSVFALKFLEWWHASDFARKLSKKASEALALPPPIIPRQNEDHVSNGPDSENDIRIRNPPIAASSGFPIFTVSLQYNCEHCPICQQEIVTPTACHSGYVFCYICIHRWVAGDHDKQQEFMKSRQSGWESGKGRCAVSGRRVLGGTEGLRKVVV